MNYGHSSSLLRSKKNVRNQIGDKNTNIFLKKGKERKKQKSSFIKTFLYAIPTIGKYVILAKSFTPIKYLVMLLRKRKSIKNAMMRSKDEGAFL
jgi:hypothetical protein